MSLKDALKGLLGKGPNKKKVSRLEGIVSSLSVLRKKSSSGVATQFNGRSSDDPHKQLVIGLDFGTAFTKVVVGEDRLRMAVPLSGKGNDIHDYLLPTRYWADKSGACTLEEIPTGTQYSDLKMSLLEGNHEALAFKRGAVFLALIFRRVRAFVFDAKKGVYGRNYIDWLVNVGLPTSYCGDEELAGAYKRMVAVAWCASALECDVSEQSIERSWQQKSRGGEDASNPGDLHWEAISLFPEFVAQVTGYVRSPLRQPDLHLLVDVGAGTLDATVFNVHDVEGEITYPILEEAVERFGTRFLVKDRIRDRGFKEEGAFAPFARVPPKQDFASLLGIDIETLESSDKPFKQHVVKVVGELLRETRRSRYPLSRRWKQGVPTFLCGGGAGCDFYAEVFVPENGRLFGFPVKAMRLPKPKDLDAKGICEAEYDRISVAYGLSYDPFDIGEVRKKDEVTSIGADGSDLGCKGAMRESGICPQCNGNGGLHRPCDNCGGSGFVA